MKAAMKRGAVAAASAEQQVKQFVDKFEPKYRTLIRAVRKRLHSRLPTAFELVYDNYNFFVIGYGPTLRPSDAIISMTAAASGVGLCFLRGAALPDPARILLGSGNQTRFIRVESPDVLARPEVEALIAAAVRQTKPFPRQRSADSVVIRSVSKKQRPRQKPAD
jgi:hypothetical protein